MIVGRPQEMADFPREGNRSKSATREPFPPSELREAALAVNGRVRAPSVVLARVRLVHAPEVALAHRADRQPPSKSVRLGERDARRDGHLGRRSAVALAASRDDARRVRNRARVAAAVDVLRDDGRRVGRVRLVRLARLGERAGRRVGRKQGDARGRVVRRLRLERLSVGRDVRERVVRPVEGRVEPTGSGSSLSWWEDNRLRGQTD